jgi:hypothetical protein
LVTPDTISVTGPRSYLDSLDQEMVLIINDITKIGQQSLTIKIEDQMNSELKSKVKEVKIDFTIDNLVNESVFVMNGDSTERYLFLYNRPASFAKLEEEQLLQVFIGDTLPFYTIYSSVIDTTFHD